MDPFQRFVGLVPGNRSLTLYQLIGVADGETDLNKLKVAFQKVALELKQADRSVDPEGWKTVVERVKKAQAVLLSPEANAKYYADLKARAVAAPPREPKVESAPQPNPMSDLTPFLPTGDPGAALDIALLETSTAVATAPWFAPSEVRMQSLANEISGLSTPQPTFGGSSSYGNSPAFGNSAVGAPGMNVTKPLLKKPTRAKSSPLSRAMPLIMLFACAFGVLGFGGYMLYSSNQKTQLAQANANDPAIPAAPQAPAKADPIMGNLAPINPNANRPPRRSGLPGVNEEGTPVEPMNELPPVQKPEEWKEEPANEPMKPAEEDMAAQPNAPMPEPMEPEKPTGNLGDLVNNSDKPDAPKPEEPMAEPEVKPTAAQIKQFSDAMNLARKQLAPRAIDKFEAAIAKAEPNAISEKQKKQLERLKTMGEAVKRYEDALLKSIASRGAGDNIQVKNTVVGWVEGSGNKFKVRVGGETQSYTTITAPLGLSNALVDLSISPDDSTTKLSKACVALLSAKVAAREEVNQWLEEAVTAGLIESDFRSVVDEKYDESE